MKRIIRVNARTGEIAEQTATPEERRIGGRHFIAYILNKEVPNLSHWDGITNLYMGLLRIPGEHHQGSYPSGKARLPAEQGEQYGRLPASGL